MNEANKSSVSKFSLSNWNENFQNCLESDRVKIEWKRLRRKHIFIIKIETKQSVYFSGSKYKTKNELLIPEISLVVSIDPNGKPNENRQRKYKKSVKDWKSVTSWNPRSGDSSLSLSTSFGEKPTHPEALYMSMRFEGLK